MWVFASIVLMGTCFLSNGRGFEVSSTRSKRLSYQDTSGVLDDFFQNEGSGERGRGITEVFTFTSSQSLSDDVAENPGSSPQGENGQEIPFKSEPDKVTIKIGGQSQTGKPDSEVKTQASKSAITDISKKEFRDSPDTQSRTNPALIEIGKEPRYGARKSSNRANHRGSLGKMKEEMQIPADDVTSDSEVSEDYDDNIDNDNDVDSIYTLAHFRHELYAYVDEQVAAANRSMVALQAHLQQKISQLESRLVENMAYISLLETKIRVSATPLPGDIRLLSRDNCGRVSRAGYLLFYTGTQWGFVCDDFFNAAAIKVACTQLGYPGPRSGLKSEPSTSTRDQDRQLMRRWQDSYQIVMDDVQCTGDESAIDYCRHEELGKHDCSMDEVVYLSC
ncbi:unnamed protein product [Candidula unifasciata]|uniref:SRCR domain-containing protein n=1 Tax=Candidula unifasciata TaxID=100452 RepID=A0A8S3YTS3_9EUPU|nr:unnamed protein product [Candidula unifasciata]